MSAIGRPRVRPDKPDVDPAVWKVAFTVVVGALAVVFDTTIVSVALNDLAADFHAQVSTIQWVSTGYLLAIFVTIPVAGWAQSMLGGKRLWIVALGVFLLGSVLCACAWNAASLIGFRVLQGVGSGMILPLMTTLIMQAAGGRNVGTVMSVATLPIAMGPIFGPILGGIVLSLGQWKWLFLINIPFCGAGVYLSARNLHDDRTDARSHLDWVGLLLLSPGVATMIFGLSRVETAGGFGRPEVLAPLFAGLALVAVFVFRAVPRGRESLVDLRLFAHSPLASSSALGFLTGAALYGALLLMPLYWQQLRGETALGAGLLLIPQGVGTLLTRRWAGRATDTIGPRSVGLTGFTVTCHATICERDRLTSIRSRGRAGEARAPP